MADKVHHCPRCGQVGVANETDKTVDFNCPSHGLIWQDQKPAPEPAAEPEVPEAQAEGGEPASSSVDPVAEPVEKSEPKPLN